jgi:hypothetical protein
MNPNDESCASTDDFRHVRNHRIIFASSISPLTEAEELFERAQPREGSGARRRVGIFDDATFA